MSIQICMSFNHRRRVNAYKKIKLFYTCKYSWCSISSVIYFSRLLRSLARDALLGFDTLQLPILYSGHPLQVKLLLDATAVWSMAQVTSTAVEYLL